MEKNNEKEEHINTLSGATMIGIRDGMNFNLENLRQKERISKRLTEIRMANKLTRAEYAERIGVNIFTYASYEKGRSEPPNAVLVRLANAFDLSLDYICCRTDNPHGMYVQEKEGSDKKEKRLLELRYQLEAIQSEIDELRKS